MKYSFDEILAEEFKKNNIKGVRYFLRPAKKTVRCEFNNHSITFSLEKYIDKTGKIGKTEEFRNYIKSKLRNMNAKET